MMKKNINPILVIVKAFLFSFIYSLLRYNVFGDTPWEDLPLFVMNKVFALTSIILFSYYQFSIIKSEWDESKIIRDYAVIFGVFHILISTIIISPAYFPKFFNALKFNLIGELSLFLGVIASGLLLILFSKNILESVKNKAEFNNRIAKSFFVFTAAHVIIMGYKGWFEPSSWQGWLPPITLLSFVVAVIPLVYKIIFKKTKR